MSLYTVLIAIFFVLLFALIIFGILHKPIRKPVKIPGNVGVFNKQCGREKVTCNLDADCEEVCIEAQSGESYVCKALPDTAGLTETQKKMIGASGAHGDKPMKTNKFCVPEKATLTGCDVAHGGIPVLSGWSGGDPMSFECMCAYPGWASSRDCDKDGACTGQCHMNPNVCAGGVFDWDLTQRTEEPTSGLCNCPPGTEMVIDYNGGIPKCVSTENIAWYNDVEMTTGRRGGQPIVSVTNTAMTDVIDQTTCDDNRYTKCKLNSDKDGCCLMEGATCCGLIDGKGFCCPKNWTCDIANKRCVEDAKQCDSKSVICDKGCCPVKNGTCCSDGLTCCPPSFPVCDPINGTCNPRPIPMKKEECSHVSDTQCGDNCCAARNATCCGDGKHCCPMEYPVCDLEKNQCKPE